MRVFFDTNVLVSAFATRGLCADVFRLVLADHDLVVGEVVLDELKRVLRSRIKLPPDIVDAAIQLLGEYEVVAKSREPVAVDIPDASDRWVLTAAVDGKAHVLITGDRDLLELRESVPIAIVDPRGFWTMLSRGRPD